jgi:hypothetical protein
MGRSTHKDSRKIYFAFLWFLYKFLLIFELGANSWDLKDFENIKENGIRPLGRIWPIGWLLTGPVRPARPSHGPASSPARRPGCEQAPDWSGGLAVPAHPVARQPAEGTARERAVWRLLFAEKGWHGDHRGCWWRRCTVGGGSAWCGSAPAAGGVEDLHMKVSREDKLGETTPNGEEREWQRGLDSYRRRGWRGLREGAAPLAPAAIWLCSGAWPWRRDTAGGPAQYEQFFLKKYSKIFKPIRFWNGQRWSSGARKFSYKIWTCRELHTEQLSHWSFLKFGMEFELKIIEPIWVKFDWIWILWIWKLQNLLKFST